MALNWRYILNIITQMMTEIQQHLWLFYTFETIGLLICIIVGPIFWGKGWTHIKPLPKFKGGGGGGEKKKKKKKKIYFRF